MRLDATNKKHISRIIHVADEVMPKIITIDIQRTFSYVGREQKSISKKHEVLNYTGLSTNTSEGVYNVGIWLLLRY